VPTAIGRHAPARRRSASLGTARTRTDADVNGETSREAPRGSEGPEVDHRSGGRLGGPESTGTWDRPCKIRVEPMTARQLLLPDGVGGLCVRAARLVRLFRRAGLMPARIVNLRGAAATSRMPRTSPTVALTSGVTGPSVARSGAADSEVAPLRSALVACCRCHELPPAVSGCLVPAATCFHRSGDLGLAPARALGATSAKHGPRGPGIDVDGGN
jgi:hypothetical protein